MGDLVKDSVDGELCFIPQQEFLALKGSKISAIERVSLFADMCRVNALYMIARSGSGHIGSSFSSLDIVSWILLEVLGKDDVYFSSKGHDAPGYYAALYGIGAIEEGLIHSLRRIGGLPGHPDIGTPGVVTNTGSLGMGISKAKGMVLANRFFGKSRNIFVMTGDGELQEGQIWESLGSAANLGLHEVTVIVDHNKLQSDTYVENVSSLGDLQAKFEAFGWVCGRCDGNDISEFADVLDSLKKERKPKVIIADTVKGCGVSFMEHTNMDSDVEMYRFHSGAPDSDVYQKALGELLKRIEQKAASSNANKRIATKFLESKSTVLAGGRKQQKLIEAYARALLDIGSCNPNVMVLDADLVLDTGLIPFREKFPSRFVEFGIAEQDMVSAAGGMALMGVTPIVHSFSCFLSARPLEQMYNNATERTKIVYVGSLAGVVPGGPGHSHQAVRDISTVSSIPGLTVIEPSSESEVKLALEWAVRENSGSTYIRLVSIPFQTPVDFSESTSFVRGVGSTLLKGDSAVIMAAGPIMLAEAATAAKKISEQNIKISVVNMPWLNYVDEKWLVRLLKNKPNLVILDNHYASGGLGSLVMTKITQLGLPIKVEHLYIPDIPPSGTNPEVLRAVGLDSDSIVAALIRLGVGK